MKYWKIILIMFGLVALFSFYGKAQTKEAPEKKEMTEFNAAEERQSVKFNVIPGPMYDPSTKFGIFVAPMLTYYPSKGDLISPASTTTVYGMFTTNKSYIMGLNQELYLQEDRWRIRVRGGGGGLNKDFTLYDINPDGSLNEEELTEADAKQKILQVEAYVMYKTYKKLYLGFGSTFKKINIVGNDDRSDSLVLANGLTSSSGNMGLMYKLDYDTRDNVMYPYSGYLFSYTGYQYFNSDGKENKYFNNQFQALGFWSVTSDHRHIIATKGYANILTGSPESANFSYYGRINGDVQRGYQSGRRVDKNAINIEVEYRWTTPLLDNRLRFMSLLGGGKVFGEYEDFTDAEWLPVVGLGARYAVLPYERINIRFDVTYSKDDFIWYFGIREAF